MHDLVIGTGVVIAGYFIGGVPFGLLIARWVSGIDVRQHGSGNIGATNVYRLLGWRAGLAVWTLDVCKGLVPTVAAGSAGLSPGWQIAAGIASVVGHSFSPFLRFRGGKGAATSMGVMLGVMWPVGVIAFVLWALVIAAAGYVSLGTIVGALSLVPATLIVYPGDRARLVFAATAAILTIARHRDNMRRLAQGTESRFRRPGARDADDDRGSDTDA